MADQLIPTDDLWDLNKKDGDPKVKEELVRRHQRLVRYLADHMAQKLQGPVDVEAMVEAGIFGMMDAIEEFDPERGIKFKTYCSTRVRGAMLNYLRQLDRRTRRPMDPD
ncbi:MAG: sigma-70 family RNA polymerase sigma factor [Planctomycetes bacterium]|nr:sigma-70 family RNA polymerase sigma factor [Planctomycetota bacterium]MCP4770884.1 sigma-70 family RNA polymerase sigma factor [Planctomycetota bacterium]MCP4862291.1 sigma-70 family RNA polymerase sigma factor [Planctomycetota bacterium]